MLDLLDKLNEKEIERIYDFAKDEQMKIINRISDLTYSRLTIITTRQAVREILSDVEKTIINPKE